MTVEYTVIEKDASSATERLISILSTSPSIRLTREKALAGW